MKSIPPSPDVTKVVESSHTARRRSRDCVGGYCRSSDQVSLLYKEILESSNKTRQRESKHARCMISPGR